MRNLVFILFMFLSIASFAQNSSEKDCALQSENDSWKTKLINANSIEEKINLIKEKIRFDSIYSKYVPKVIVRSDPTISNENIDINGNKCGCKILFALNYSKRKSFLFDLNSTPTQNIILNNLNAQNVSNVTYVFDKSAEAIYGSSGKCGVVFLKTSDKKLRTLINKTVL